MSFLKGNVGSILGSISPAFGAITGQGALGKILPYVSPALGMATGEGIGKLFAGGGEKEQPQANAAAIGLGKLIGADPARISSIATSIGKGANQIASAGGAQEGYSAPQLPINNVLQQLDPQILRALIQQLGGGGMR